MPSVTRLSLLLATLAAVPAAAQVVQIENTATLSYGAGMGAVTIRSNTVTLTRRRGRQTTRIEFRQAPPGLSVAAMRCTANPASIAPAPVDQATVDSAVVVDQVALNQPMLVVLTDTAGNRDPAQRETRATDYKIGAHAGIMTLTETGPNTGVFAGAVIGTSSDPAHAACDLSMYRGERLDLQFGGDDDSMPSDSSVAVDPAGYLFDSRTGSLIDGAIVSIVDATGAPAQVKGDDGQTPYPSTVVSGQAVTDASGHVYPALHGRYRFPRLSAGTYSIRVTPPAPYTAPSNRTPAELATLVDDRGRRFHVEDASYGRPFTLTVGHDLLADIPLDTGPGGDLLLTKSASVRQAAPGDVVEYRLQLRNRGVAAQAGVHVMDLLPKGLRYRRGSTRGVGEPTVAPDGRSLDFVLPPLRSSASVELRYLVSIAPGAPVGEALNRARATGPDGAASNEAVAAVRLQPLLFTDALTLTGRVTEGDCDHPARGRTGVAGIRLMLENGTFTVTDRDGLYHVEGVRPGRHVVQIDTASIPASHEPVACDADTRAAGSIVSRFVEGVGGTMQRVDFQLRRTGRAVAQASVLPIVAADDATAAGNRDWLRDQQPGVAWLFPAPDHNPRAPVIRVAIKHLPGQRVALTIGGVPVDPLAFDTTDKAGAVAVSRWSGIPLSAGDNRLVARVLEADGRVTTTLERVVHVSGAPARATLDLSNSRLVADGLGRPLVAMRVTDATGRPVRAGTLVPFTVDQPYRAATDAPDRPSGSLVGKAAEATAQVVGDNGIAFAALAPTTQAGAVHVTVSLADDKAVRTTALRAWLSGARREWTVVGFGAGSAGYRTLDTHARKLEGSTRGTIADGQLALYAKGQIKGSWLLTLAYDSDRAFDPDRGLLGTIDPDRYYTVYGDGAAQGYDAATRRKLYLRLERREAYALFGDFETGLTDTELARYSRTLSGFKVAYEGRALRATGFAARADSLHVRDEIRGNGLSGPYRLSGRGLVPNSDKVLLEVRDRYRSERIVSQTAMTRHIDYDVDPALGTLRFRSPVLSRDPDGNPIVIVVDFEVSDGRIGKAAAGARIAGWLGDTVEVGASTLRDETLGAATVIAADLKARPAPGTDLRAEIAAGGKGGLRAGRAFVAEAQHHGSGIDLLGYVRQQDIGFGVGQQNLVESGTRKIGVDGRIALTSSLSLAGTAWRQTSLGTDGRRTAADLRLEYRRQQGTLYAGAQLANDRGIDGKERDSRLLTIGGSRSLLGGRLTLAGQTQVAPGGDKASVDFPVRHQLTAAYRVTPGVRLIGGYEITDGDDAVTHTVQLGFDVAPWAGGKLTGTMNQQAAGENGARSFAQYGLVQSLPLGGHWALDATFDAATTVRGQVTHGAQVQPLRGGVTTGLIGQDALGGDYGAATLGASYRAARWSGNGRIEYRRADAGTRWGLTANVLRSLGEGRTAAGSARIYTVHDRTGAVATSAAGDLALALRPLDSRWSLLERFSLRHERADAGFDDRNALGVPATGAGDQLTSRAINNLALSYRTGAEGQGHGLEATLYYGAKYVGERFEDNDHDGFIDVIGTELHQDLGRRFDLGMAASVQHAWGASAWAWSGGPSVGVSPAPNLWISAGVNVAGYRDRDFEQDRYTRAGPYLTTRFKFDQFSLAGAARALIGKRS